jgi:hypothetical protein
VFGQRAFGVYGADVGVVVVGRNDYVVEVVGWQLMVDLVMRR